MGRELTTFSKQPKQVSPGHATLCTSRARRRGKRSNRRNLSLLRQAELLELPICDLGLTLSNTPMAARVERVMGELATAKLAFRPYTWLSTEWFAPDGLPGFALPFHLLHPRLARLEREATGRLEGGELDECLRLLRHETGHAIDNAYGLHRRASWRAVFGRFSSPYRASYIPEPGLRDYVINLDNWYAQSHPAEDWAETFAVWLDPRSNWREVYRGWPALEKLEYVDSLMREVRRSQALDIEYERVEDIEDNTTKLSKHFKRRERSSGEAPGAAYDAELFKLFCIDESGLNAQSAANFLTLRSAPALAKVTTGLNLHSQVAKQVLKELIDRSQQLRLVLDLPPRAAQAGVTTLLRKSCQEFMARRNVECFR